MLKAKREGKRYTIRVDYRDRRDGPAHWSATVEASSICAAIGRGVRQFWKWHGWRGRGPSGLLSVTAQRVRA